MEKTKNGVVCTQNRGTEISLQVKISLCSEITAHSEIFAILAKFCYYCKNFAILAKFPQIAPACILHIPIYIRLVSASISSFLA